MKIIKGMTAVIKALEKGNHLIKTVEKREIESEETTAEIIRGIEMASEIVTMTDLKETLIIKAYHIEEKTITAAL